MQNILLETTDPRVEHMTVEEQLNHIETTLSTIEERLQPVLAAQ